MRQALERVSVFVCEYDKISMMSGDYALKTRTNYKLSALSTGKVLIKPSHLSKPFLAREVSECVYELQTVQFLRLL